MSALSPRIRDYCDSVVRVLTGRENGAQRQLLREPSSTSIPGVEVSLRLFLYNRSCSARSDNTIQEVL